MEYMYYMFYKYQFSQHFPIMIKMWAKPKMASISDHKFESVWKAREEWGKDYGLSYLQFISYINGLFYLSVIWNISRSALPSI